ncbi:MAG TPA: glycosyltransferase family 39 protein [Candidatus Acidoferrales bacterium]|nr:glycosyltransferase family 39 protein [Candidatus Acidoferrales bacterium]
MRAPAISNSRFASAEGFLLKFRLPLVVIIGLAWYLRARHPHYASAYMDETIYVLFGRMFLTGHFDAPLNNPLNSSFGWYLWPVLAAWADQIRGLAGVRELGAAMGALTVCAVYGFSKRVFSRAVGLASALVFAFLGPAVIASRIATRDVGSILFLAVGLWLFARAWQTQDWPTWLAAALSLFAAFLCKYLIAVYFPFLVILSLWKRRRAILAFGLTLAILCGAYAIYFRKSLIALLQYGRAYGSLKAPAATAWQIYFTDRLDFWILFALALLAWFPDGKAWSKRVTLLFGGVAIMPIFQLISRADYDYWKHVNYSFLFLVPLAMQGLIVMLRRIAPASYSIPATVMAGCLAVGLGWMGNAWRINRFVFWPNVEPVVAYFDGHLMSNNRILIDDTVFRYYFSPPLRQWQMVDPFYFRYGAETGLPAYAAAVRDGSFDYIVLDGGIGEDARDMRAAIQPNLANRYNLRVSTPDPVTGHEIDIFERTNPPAMAPAQNGPQVIIGAPAQGALVQTHGDLATLSGTVKGIQAGDYVLVDVFTNQWYRQGGKFFPGAPDGAFTQAIHLGGGGRQQCFHVARARLFDAEGHFIARAMNFAIARANADGSPPNCR